jgi:hypothetical protein
MAAVWKRSFERRRWTAKRTASAMTTPARGASKIVKNPKIGMIRLPIRDNSPDMAAALM